MVPPPRTSAATGADSMFSGAEPNYLSCSGNELVTSLDVYFNGDESLRNAVAKVGEQITMNVHSVNALNGLSVPNASFTVTMSHGKIATTPPRALPIPATERW